MYSEAFPNFIKIGELCFLVTLNGFDLHALKSIRLFNEEGSIAEYMLDCQIQKKNQFHK